MNINRGNIMISIPVSIGELIDKIVILKIKIKNIEELDRRQKCIEEHDLLLDIAKQNKFIFLKEMDELKKVNQRLWNIENSIRQKTMNKDFDDEFIELAQNSFRTNEAREKIKWKINRLANSEIIEQKEWVGYKESD